MSFWRLTKNICLSTHSEEERNNAIMNINILDYGAVADGKTVCTKEIQAAIDDCAVDGGVAF